jgi:outer membrane protein assembly factor BamB
MKANSAFPLPWLAYLAAMLCCGGCSNVSGMKPVPDFSLTTGATSISLSAGGPAQPVTIAAAGLNGFSGAIRVAITGIPAGVTASPSAFTLSAGSSQTVNFSAATSAPSASATIQFQGVAGGSSHDVSAPILVSPVVLRTGTDVITYHFDNARTGLNPRETDLAPATVTSSKFGLQRIFQVDGKVDAQPLYLSQFMFGRQPHNVVFAVTEHGSVYAFEADTGVQLWRASTLGTNESPSDDHGCGQISPEIGITSTPVIDRHAGPNGTIFLVGMSEDSGGAYHQRLHALDLTTGKELAGSPVEIHATYPGNGAGSSNGQVIFDPGQYAERAGLLLMNGTIYLGWTSHCDQDPYTGWLMAYSEATLKQTSVLNLTPNGSEGSIWMAGGGLAADSSGNIYFLDANGTFDTTLKSNGFPSQGDFGNGLIKVSTAHGALTVADYFEPSDTVNLSNTDTDLGSGGVIVLPDQTDAAGKTRHLVVGAGKNQTIYLADRDKMGKFNSNDNSALYQEVDGAIGGVWSKPAYFNGTVYYGAVDDTLKAFPFTKALLPGSPAVQSANAFPYPGTTPAVSALNGTNGIVWAVENSSPAVLHAYDAKTLHELYNSNQAPKGRDNFGDGNKFITPAIADGRVFIGTPSGVAEFGLLK